MLKNQGLTITSNIGGSFHFSVKLLMKVHGLEVTGYMVSSLEYRVHGFEGTGYVVSHYPKVRGLQRAVMVVSMIIYRIGMPYPLKSGFWELCQIESNPNPQYHALQSVQRFVLGTSG